VFAFGLRILAAVWRLSETGIGFARFSRACAEMFWGSSKSHIDDCADADPLPSFISFSDRPKLGLGSFFEKRVEMFRGSFQITRRRSSGGCGFPLNLAGAATLALRGSPILLRGREIERSFLCERRSLSTLRKLFSTSQNIFLTGFRYQRYYTSSLGRDIPRIA
jgi:hypothetical protein